MMDDASREIMSKTCTGSSNLCKALSEKYKTIGLCPLMCLVVPRHAVMSEEFSSWLTANLLGFNPSLRL